MEATSTGALPLLIRGFTGQSGDLLRVVVPTGSGGAQVGTSTLLTISSGGNFGLSTTTPGTLLAIQNGESYLGGAVTAAGPIKAPYFSATSSTASTFPVASSTSFSVGNVIQVLGQGSSAFTGSVGIAPTTPGPLTAPGIGVLAGPLGVASTSPAFTLGVGGTILYGTANATSTNIGNELVSGSVTIKGPLELLGGCQGCPAGGSGAVSAGNANALAY